jgi:hypothetical protein
MPVRTWIIAPDRWSLEALGRGPEKGSAKKEELFHPHFEAPRLAV